MALLPTGLTRLVYKITVKIGSMTKIGDPWEQAYWELLTEEGS